MRPVFISCCILGLALVSCGGRKDSDVVGIQPFATVDKVLIDAVARAIEDVFHIRACVLPSRPIPTESFVNIKTPRYRADRIIEILKEDRPDSVDYVLGLTGEDISVTVWEVYGAIKEPKSNYEDWGVFGYGYIPGQASVVSTFRLGNRDTKTTERLVKIAVHEVGHNLGLGHCTSKLCVMQGAAGKISTIDGVELGICDNCKKQVDL